MIWLYQELNFLFFIEYTYERKVYKLVHASLFMVLQINRNFALLYGIMLGDGCLSLVYGKKKFVAITGSQDDDIPFFECIIKPIIKQLIDKEIPLKYRSSKRAIDLNFVNHRLFDFIASIGFPIGKKGNKLFIPKIFYDKNMVKYVVRGFFATDGSLVLTDNNGTLYPRVEATSISESLLKEINDFINKKGINCKFYEAKRKFGFPENRQQPYRLQMNGKENLKKFERLIGFINPKQIEKLNNYYGAEES